MPETPVFRRLRQEKYCKFEVSLFYVVSSRLLIAKPSLCVWVRVLMCMCVNACYSH